MQRSSVLVALAGSIVLLLAVLLQPWDWLAGEDSGPSPTPLTGASPAPTATPFPVSGDDLTLRELVLTGDEISALATNGEVNYLGGTTFGFRAPEFYQGGLPDSVARGLRMVYWEMFPAVGYGGERGPGPSEPTLLVIGIAEYDSEEDASAAVDASPVIYSTHAPGYRTPASGLDEGSLVLDAVEDESPGRMLVGTANHRDDGEILSLAAVQNGPFVATIIVWYSLGDDDRSAVLRIADATRMRIEGES